MAKTQPTNTSSKQYPSDNEEIFEVPADIMLFTEKLVIKAELDALPDDFREIYIQKLAYQVMRRISLTLMLQAGHDKIEKVVSEAQEQKQHPKTLYESIKKEIVDFDEIVVQALKDFSSEFLIAVKKNG